MLFLSGVHRTHGFPSFLRFCCFLFPRLPPLQLEVCTSVVAALHPSPLSPCICAHLMLLYSAVADVHAGEGIDVPMMGAVMGMAVVQCTATAVVSFVPSSFLRASTQRAIAPLPSARMTSYPAKLPDMCTHWQVWGRLQVLPHDVDVRDGGTTAVYEQPHSCGFEGQRL